MNTAPSEPTSFSQKAKPCGVRVTKALVPYHFCDHNQRVIVVSQITNSMKTLNLRFFGTDIPTLISEFVIGTNLCCDNCGDEYLKHECGMIQGGDDSYRRAALRAAKRRRNLTRLATLGFERYEIERREQRRRRRRQRRRVNTDHNRTDIMDGYVPCLLELAITQQIDEYVGGIHNNSDTREEEEKGDEPSHPNSPLSLPGLAVLEEWCDQFWGTGSVGQSTRSCTDSSSTESDSSYRSSSSLSCGSSGVLRRDRRGNNPSMETIRDVCHMCERWICPHCNARPKLSGTSSVITLCLHCKSSICASSIQEKNVDTMTDDHCAKRTKLDGYDGDSVIAICDECFQTQWWYPE